MTPTRRWLIHQVGRAGGVAAAYHTMAALGLLPVPAQAAASPSLAPGSGTGKRVVILGAGIAGMVAALELGRAGYECRVLEARARPGGRNWTLRAGDTVQEDGSVQQVAWDAAPHLYFNPGPGRLPYHHTTILNYCRELGVNLELMCNDNRAAWLHDDAAFDGKPQRNAAVVNDARGYVAELAAKAVDANAMDAPVSTEDRERLRGFLRQFGALDRDMRYRGTTRAGYAEPPGAGTHAGTPLQPLDLARIVQSDFWEFPLQFGEFYTMHPTMMQPVGGMGRIGEAFGKRLGDVITYGARVTALRRTGDGARVEWVDNTGAAQSIEAPCVIVTIPCPVLRKLDADFSPALRAAIATPDYVMAGKIAFQAERRFWELDDKIYGGISWTSRDITQIWYPSAGLQQQKGILVGAYIWSNKLGEAFAAKTPAQRIDDSLADGAHIHPDYRQSLGKGVSVAWKNVPFSGAGWAEWDRAGRAAAYPVLLAGEGPFVFAGEHVSYITGWQEGAALSAHVAVDAVAKRLAATP